jgi:chromosomal replication initiator protein
MPQLDWNATINSIREALPQTQFTNWFKPLELIRCNERSVVLGVPSKFHGEWLRNNYSVQLTQAIRNQCGLDVQLEFEIQVREENYEASLSEHASLSGEAGLETPAAPARPTLRIVGSAPPDDEIDAPKYVEPPNIPSFNNPYFELETNRVAFQCARLFAEGNDRQLNPLVIHAGVGMGKTHILSEIGFQAHSQDRTLKVRYTNAELFTAEMVGAIKSDSILSFKRKYREGTDILLFDDIAGLTRRTRTQEELLHIYNEMLSRGGRVAFTTSISPHRFEDFIEPLKSRILSAVIADIKPPTFEERVQILAQMCMHNQIIVSDDVLRSMADRGQKDTRELLGVLFRLHLQAKLENRPLDQEFLSRGGWVREQQKEIITMDEIIGLVEHNFGVPRSELISKSRKSLTAWARQVAMYLARHYTLLPLEEIGKNFGRDHATVIHAFQKVTETMEKQPPRRFEVDFLKEKLQTRSPRGSNDFPL